MRRLADYALSPLGVIGGLLVLLVVCIVMSSRAVDQKCATLLGYARTTRDTLDAKIACERMHSSNDEAMAVSIGAGLVAGSVAGSASR